VGPDHLSRLEIEESVRDIDDHILDVYIFKVEAITNYLSDIALLLRMGVYLEGYSKTQKRHLMVHETYYKLNVGQLYELGLDGILTRCVIHHERIDILCDFHSGVVGGHVGGKETTQKILQE